LPLRGNSRRRLFADWGRLAQILGGLSCRCAAIYAAGCLCRPVRLIRLIRLIKQLDPSDPPDPPDPSADLPDPPDQTA
jgi:hypothetical protein